jgi:peptidoglycan-associated lipoprotein
VVTGVPALDNASGGSTTPSNKAWGDDNKGADAKASALQPVIYFEFDSDSLDEASRAKLTENANWLKEDSARVLTIEGHTDESGTTDYNLALGERRARETRDFIIRLGIDGSRVSIITYGEERPASSDDSENRRSVFIATKK